MMVQTSAVIPSVLAAERACRVFNGDAFCLRSLGNEPRPAQRNVMPQGNGNMHCDMFTETLFLTKGE